MGHLGKGCGSGAVLSAPAWQVQVLGLLSSALWIDGGASQATGYLHVMLRPWGHSSSLSRNLQTPARVLKQRRPCTPCSPDCTFGCHSASTTLWLIIASWDTVHIHPDTALPWERPC